MACCNFFQAFLVIDSCWTIQVLSALVLIRLFEIEVYYYFLGITSISCNYGWFTWFIGIICCQSNFNFEIIQAVVGLGLYRQFGWFLQVPTFILFSIYFHYLCPFCSTLDLAVVVIICNSFDIVLYGLLVPDYEVLALLLLDYQFWLLTAVLIILSLA